MSKRLDPTTLPGYDPILSEDQTPGEVDAEVRYAGEGSDLIIDWSTPWSSTGDVCCFRLPLDILTEEQVIEILKRNGCPVP